jgi:hypothetical protein
VAAAKILAVKVGTLPWPTCVVLVDCSLTQPAQLVFSICPLQVPAVVEVDFLQMNMP